MRRKTLLFFISVFYSLIGVAQKEKKYSAVNPAQGIIEVKEDGVLYSTSKYSLWGYTDVNVSESTNANKQNNDTLDNVIDLIKKNVIQEKDSN